MKRKFHIEEAALKHFGILGMRWGQRRAYKHNQHAVRTGKGTLKPTYQYRDTQGNLVSRYGPGKYGGGPKPTSDPKADQKFMRDVNRTSKTQKATTRPLPKVKGSGPLGFKTSADHAKDLAASWKAKKVKDIALDLAKGTGKAAFEFTVGFVATMGAFKLAELAIDQFS